jgi:hypothetical protein
MMSRVEPEQRSSTDEVLPGTRWLLVAFAVLTLLATVELFLLADVADRYWAWSIKTELTAAFLGAAYASGFALSVLALRQDRWSRIRVSVVTVTAFTVLTSVATIVHMHRLLLMSGGPVARAAAWIWLAVYLVVPLACLRSVARQERRRGGAGPVIRPMPDWLTALLTVQGAVLFAAGVLLFGGGLTVHHHVKTTATGFWPWELTPLSSQAIGAWLIALAVAAAMTIRELDLGRLLVPGVTYTVFGVVELVALIWYWPQVRAEDPSLWIYLTMLIAIVGTGGYGWRAARSAPADRAPTDGDAGRSSPSLTSSSGRPQVGA